MSHRQGIVSTAGLIGGISRSQANGVLSSHETVLHEKDGETTTQKRRPSLLTRLRRLQRRAGGGSENPCAG
jgi:hypothetical protein